MANQTSSLSHRIVAPVKALAARIGEGFGDYFAGVLNPWALLWVALFLGLILIPPAWLAAPTLDQPDRITGRVSDIVSGDTFILRTPERAWTVKLTDLAAKPPYSLEGRAARDALSRAILGPTLTCTRRWADPNQRYLARCALSNGADIAPPLLAAGHARETCFTSGNRYGTCAPVPAGLGWVSRYIIHVSAEVILPGLRWTFGGTGDGLSALWNAVRWLFYTDADTHTDDT